MYKGVREKSYSYATLHSNELSWHRRLLALTARDTVQYLSIFDFCTQKSRTRNAAEYLNDGESGGHKINIELNC